MATIQKHPEYEEMEDYYTECYDLIEKGDSKTVKGEGVTYLPKLESMILDGGVQGTTDYNTFKQYAIWRDIPKQSLSQITGVMFEKKSDYNLPTQIEDYKNSVTVNGQGLSFLETLTTFSQLTYGRCGLIASPVNDITGVKLPVITINEAPTIINWHTSVNDKGDLIYDMITIMNTEQEYNEDNHSYSDLIFYTIHALSPENIYYKVRIAETDYDEFNKSYETRLQHSSYIEPIFKGSFLNRVPFVSVNLTNVDDTIEIPPLYEQAKLSVHCYNASALYRKKSRQQTWALLLLAGFKKDEDQDDIVSGIKSDGVMKTSNPNAKGEYITPASEALAELGKSVMDLRIEAQEKGVVISEKNSVESGTAIESRKGNQVNEYKTIAETRSKGIIKILGIIMEWGFGIAETENDWITPFTDYSKFIATPEDLLKVVEAKNQGALPEEDVYNYAKRNGYTNFKDFATFKANLPDSVYNEE